MTNTTKTNKAVTMLQGELRNNANVLAEATASAYGATEKQAGLLNEYFMLTFGEKNWFEVDSKEKTPLSDEVRIQRALVVDTLAEKGHTNGRVVWKRIRDWAWKLAYPNEAEAEAKAKEQAKAQGETEKAEAVEISYEAFEFAQLLAGACDWDKSLANKVLAKVFAEANKAS
jgi:hypothetical protein